MKNFIIVSMLIVIAMLLAACTTDIGKMEDNIFNVSGESVGEWVSPEGVHYWWRTGGGLTPRYCSDGNIMIDESGR